MVNLSATSTRSAPSHAMQQPGRQYSSRLGPRNGPLYRLVLARPLPAPPRRADSRAAGTPMPISNHIHASHGRDMWDSTCPGSVFANVIRVCTRAVPSRRASAGLSRTSGPLPRPRPRLASHAPSSPASFSAPTFSREVAAPPHHRPPAGADGRPLPTLQVSGQLCIHSIIVLPISASGRQIAVLACRPHATMHTDGFLE